MRLGIYEKEYVRVKSLEAIDCKGFLTVEYVQRTLDLGIDRDHA